MRHIVAALAIAGVACSTLAAPSATPATPPADCARYQAPTLAGVGAETHHVKGAALVVEVTSSCTLRARVGVGPLQPLNDTVITLRITERTTFNTAPQGDRTAFARFGLKVGDVFSLSFDARPFPDGSYPLNYMNW